MKMNNDFTGLNSFFTSLPRKMKKKVKAEYEKKIVQFM